MQLKLVIILNLPSIYSERRGSVIHYMESWVLLRGGLTLGK